MVKYILTPPVAFIITLIAMMAFAGLLSRLSFKRKSRGTDIEKSYACGEDTQTNLIQPEYGEFFPFAFFFTILHVVTLIVTTVPAAKTESFLMAVIYVAGALISLVIVFRR